MLLVLIGIISCYTIGSKIDYWWHLRFPPKLDPKGIEILKHFPFYQRLSQEEKLRFQSRVTMFNYNKAYTIKNLETIPEDLKVLIAANAVILTLHQDDFLMEHFEQIVLYPDAFPSPQYPKTWHYSEIETTDGTLIFAISKIIPSQFDPSHFNPVLYEWARAWIRLYRKIPENLTPDPLSLTRISSLSPDLIKKTIGLDTIEWPAVMLHHYFRYPENFRKFEADKYKQLKTIFSRPTTS